MSEHAISLPSADEIAQLPPDGGDEFNRLVFETSPYLRQHARNPVDWYPWGEEAFAKAKDEDKPVFLSVGYSSCHWCHVMAHESFEDEETAKLMNELFVNIKVDREERPDVDDIYMKAVQMLAGRGGWPMSVFMLPDERPYWGGTYFPREDRGGQRGFKSILRYMSQAYHDQREEVDEQASRIAEGIAQQAGGAQPEAQGPASRALMQALAEMLRGNFDRQRGGFGGAPKFPPHMSLDALLYEIVRTEDDSLEPLIRVTLDHMMLGGVHDHVGGGFHRYSTDPVWLLPHFEKMLYDNGQLARNYTAAYRAFRDPRYRDVVERLCDWVLREMTAPGGGFYSAYDADSEGEEGKFYVWDHAEVLQVLGEEQGMLFSQVYNIEKDGNFVDEATRQPTGLNIPHLSKPMDEIAEELGVDPAGLAEQMAEARDQLREARDKRIWPGLDDKVLTSWNGLMIAGLAEAGQAFERQDYTDAAARAARFVLDNMRRDGRLLRSFNHGRAKLNAYLDDYAFFSFGLLALYDATGDEEWLHEAQTLARAMLEHYWDDENGGFFFTSDDHEELLLRSKEVFDGAVPSGNGVAARVLVRLASLSDDETFSEAARATLEAGLGWMQRAPRATESLILATSEAFDTGLLGGVQSYVPSDDVVQTVDDIVEQSDARWQHDVLTADAYAERIVLSPGMNARLALRVHVAEGWHVNSHKPKQSYLIPTELSVKAEPHMMAGAPLYPTGRDAKFGFSEEVLSVYDGVFWLESSIHVAANAQAGPGMVELALVIQPCNDKECLSPVNATLKLPVTIVATPQHEPEERHTAIFDRL